MSFFSAFIDVPVRGVNDIFHRLEMRAELVGHHDGSMMAAGASQSNVETGLSFFFIKRNEEIHDVE